VAATRPRWPTVEFVLSLVCGSAQFGGVVGNGSEATGRRLLLTCAQRHFPFAPELDREELGEDVQRMVELLCGGEFLPAHGRYEHVNVLGDSPTSTQLQQRLRDFCTSEERRPNDYIILYMTGHGEILEDGDHVLLASDVQPRDLLLGSVRTADLIRLAVTGTQVSRLLFLLDTCYSGKGGEDMAREALRRVGYGGGVVLVAATTKAQEARPGAFTSCLERAVRSLAVAGSAPSSIRIGALVGVMKNDAAWPATQSVQWNAIGLGDDEPAFLLNPRYNRALIEADLLEQERASDRSTHEKQADVDLEERFLPRIRWFTGRHRALEDLSQWLNRSGQERGSIGPDHRVVTGQAGSGKSAVVGLISALADADHAPSVPRGGLPPNFVIRPGAVAKAIYAGSMATDDVCARLAGALGVKATSTRELLEARRGSPGPPVAVIVDAVDEAADPVGLIKDLLAPLMREPALAVRLLIAGRPHRLTAELLGTPTSSRYAVIDLDDSVYADPMSIRKYAQRILLAQDSLDSSYRPSGIYRAAQKSTLEEIASAIAEAAGPSFLVARITATTESTATRLPVPDDRDWRRALPRRAGPAMRRDLQYRLGSDAERAAQILLPLAYAQGAGLPWEDIWLRLADALSPEAHLAGSDLIWLRRSAGSYAVEGLTHDERSVYRLYHRALAEHLLTGRDEQADEKRIAGVLVSQVPFAGNMSRDWEAAHPYVLDHLATHAARGHAIDDLLIDPAFLLAAARPALLAALTAAVDRSAIVAADAYRRAARNLQACNPRERASYLALAARCGYAPQLAKATDRLVTPRVWASRWASWRPETPHRSLQGHTGPVLAVAAAEMDGRSVAVTGSADGSVRVWDVATGSVVGEPLTGHTGAVNAVAVTEMDGRLLVVTGSDDRSVRVWDLATGAPEAGALTGHGDRVSAVAVANLEGRPVAVTGSADGSVRVWDLTTGDTIAEPSTGHTGSVSAVAVVQFDGRSLAVTGVTDGSVRTWDVSTGAQFGDPLTGHTGSVAAVAVAEVEGRPVTITGGWDKSVRIWDLGSGIPVGEPFTGHTDSVMAAAITQLAGRSVAVTASADRSLRVWDLATGETGGQPLTGHTGPIYALAIRHHRDRPRAVTGSRDGSVRVWDLATGTDAAVFAAHEAAIYAIAIGEVKGQEVAVTGSADRSARIWDLATGAPVGPPLVGHSSWVMAVAIATVGDRRVVVTGSADWSVRVWDAAAGDPIGDPWAGHTGTVNALAIAEIDGRPVVVTGSADWSVRVWDLATGRPFADPCTGHSGPVLAMAVVQLHGRPVIVTGSADRSIRMWDLTTGTPIGHPLLGHTAPVHALAAADVEDGLMAVSGSGGGSVRLWKLTTGTAVTDPVTRHADSVTSATVGDLADRRITVTGSADGSVRVWDLSTGASIGQPLQGHSAEVRATKVMCLAGRPVAVTGSADRSLQMWDLDSGLAIGDPMTGHSGGVTAVAVTVLDDTAIAVSGSEDRTIRVWHLRTDGFRRGHTLVGHNHRVGAVALAEVGGRLHAVTGSDDGTVRLWDTGTGRPVNRLIRPVRLRVSAPVRSIAVTSLNGRPVAVVGCRDGEIWTWDLTSHRCLGRLVGPGEAHSGALAALGERGLVVGFGPHLHIYRDFMSGELPHTIELDAEINSIATHETSTVVVTTRLGVVTLLIPS
jgi:WD40 repeat protein